MAFIHFFGSKEGTPLMSKSQSNGLWSIILAGGDGERTRPFIEQWLGYPKPKQYCTFVGTRSMLQHTLDRADRLGAPDKKVTVVDQIHQRGLSGSAGRTGNS